MPTTNRSNSLLELLITRRFSVIFELVSCKLAMSSDGVTVEAEYKLYLRTDIESSEG